MKTIAIINQKGGTAKTTTARQLAAALALEKTVLLVDLDPQQSLTFIMGESGKPGKTIADLLQESVDGQTVSTVDAIRPGSRGDLIAGSPNIAIADTVLADVTGREYKLKEILAPVKRSYDFCIIDTPPTLGTLTVNALTAAQMAIAPAQADILSILALEQLYSTISTVKRYTNPRLSFRGIILTRYNGRAVLSREIAQRLETAAQQYGTQLFNTRVRECTALKEADLMQKSIFDYAPRSNAAHDYTAIAEELLEL